MFLATLFLLLFAPSFLHGAALHHKPLLALKHACIAHKELDFPLSFLVYRDSDKPLESCVKHHHVQTAAKFGLLYLQFGIDETKGLGEEREEWKNADVMLTRD